jgi:hypothetical protein
VYSLKFRPIVNFSGEPLNDEKYYLVATKTILFDGKDGYECLKGILDFYFYLFWLFIYYCISPFLTWIDAELLMAPTDALLLSLLVRRFFIKLHVIEKLKQHTMNPLELAASKFTNSVYKKTVDVPNIGPELDKRLIDLSK